MKTNLYDEDTYHFGTFDSFKKAAQHQRKWLDYGLKKDYIVRSCSIDSDYPYATRKTVYNSTVRFFLIEVKE